MPKTLPFYRASFNSSSIAMCDTSFIGNLLGHNDNKTLQTECTDVVQSILAAKAMAVISAHACTELHGMYQRNYLVDATNKPTYKQSDIKFLRTSNPSLYISAMDNTLDAVNSAICTLLSNRPFYDGLIGTVDNETYFRAEELQRKR